MENTAFPNTGSCVFLINIVGDSDDFYYPPVCNHFTSTVSTCPQQRG